ncbi:MAG: GNAT family N-acetyltransferase [Burkholderiaceae bacterium]|nr:GNAT family N-acetyltransferase [Microbacteriaceae bacterium]
MSTIAGISVAKPSRIRAATLGDADAIFGLLSQLEKGFVPERASFDAAYIDAVQDAGDHILLVAADESDRVIGYTLTTLARLFHTNGLSAQLQELVVDVGSRGRRVGSQLVTAVERECLARGARQLTVTSRRGASFYEGHDYRSTADYLKKTL